MKTNDTHATETTMTARTTNAAIRHALFTGDQDAARDLFHRYIDSSKTSLGMNVRQGLLFRLGVCPFGAEVVAWRSHPAFAELA